MNSKTELHRYAAVACGQMLIVGLVVGATAYTGIRDAVWRSAVTAIAPNTGGHAREADRDRVVTPAAVALVLIAALVLGVATAPSRRSITSRRGYPIDKD